MNSPFSRYPLFFARLLPQPCLVVDLLRAGGRNQIVNCLQHQEVTIWDARHSPLTVIEVCQVKLQSTVEVFFLHVTISFHFSHVGVLYQKWIHIGDQARKATVFPRQRQPTATIGILEVYVSIWSAKDIDEDGACK